MAILVSPSSATDPTVGINPNTPFTVTDTGSNETMYRRWDFGDGSGFYDGNTAVTKVYAAAGNWTVMLQRSDGTQYKTIYVQDPRPDPNNSPVFVIEKLVISPSKVKVTEWATVSVTISNTGTAAGAAKIRVDDENGIFIGSASTPVIPVGGSQATNPTAIRVQGTRAGTLKLCAKLDMPSAWS